MKNHHHHQYTYKQEHRLTNYIFPSFLLTKHYVTIHV